MNETDEHTGIAFAFIIIVACIGGIGIIWVIDTVAALIPTYTFAAIVSYGMGFMFFTLLGFQYITDGSPFPVRNVRVRVLQGAITFLDMLSQGITQLGSLDSGSAPDFIDPAVPKNRRFTVGLLLRINSGFARKWAKVVEREDPYLKLIIDVPLHVIFGIVQNGRFLEAIVYGLVLFGAFMITTTAQIGLVVVGIILTIIVVLMIIRRIYIIRQHKGLESLDMRTESSKGLQMVFDVAEKRVKTQLRLYVLGDYDNLSYTGKTVTTSEGHILKESLLNPGGK